jgi:mono/diheme cytochrome c family protein
MRSSPSRLRRAPVAPLALCIAAVAATATFVLADGPPTTMAPTPPLAPSDWPTSPSETRGRAVFEDYCVGCHGAEGRGDGPAARFLDPLPRNFQAAKFKFCSSPSGKLPLESDLLRTVTCGLPGSSMPGFPLLPEIERQDVVRYVLHLAKLGLANRRVAAEIADEGTSIEEVRRSTLPKLRDEIEESVASLRRVSAAPESATTPESVDRGRALFEKQCAACHGARGVGDGTSSHTLRDWQDAAIRPRDFTSGVFRAGSTSEDVFVRVKTGLNGTPMPSYANLPDAEIWDLVHFILSLKDPRAERPRFAPGCGGDGGGR